MAKTDKPDYLAPDHQLDVILKALKLLEYDLAGVQKMIKTWQEDGYGDYKTKGYNQADKDRPFV